MSSGVMKSASAALAVTLLCLPASAAETCLESEQRLGTCQLEFDPWIELNVWAAILATTALRNVAEDREVGKVRWQKPFGWERWLRHRIRQTGSAGYSRSGTIARFSFTYIPIGGAVAAGLTSSLPAMLDGKMPTDALEDLYIMTTAALLTSNLNDLLKIGIARRRPGVVTVDGYAGSPVAVHAFPSGHTSTVSALVSSYVGALYRRQADLWWVAALVGGTAMVTTGLARMATDDHWALDILGGMISGTLVGGTYAFAAHRAKENAASPTVTVRPIPGGVAIVGLW